MYTGFSDTPDIKTASKPAFLSSGPKKPPEFESFHPPVTGDLCTMVNLPPNIAPVALLRPVINPSMLSGPRGSAPSGILSYNIFAPKP